MRLQQPVEKEGLDIVTLDASGALITQTREAKKEDRASKESRSAMGERERESYSFAQVKGSKLVLSRFIVPFPSWFIQRTKLTYTQNFILCTLPIEGEGEKGTSYTETKLNLWQMSNGSFFKSKANFEHSEKGREREDEKEEEKEGKEEKENTRPQ